MLASRTEEYKKYCDDEYQDYVIYSSLAKREKNLEKREILERMSKQEHTHYLFWKEFLSENYEPKISKFTLYVVLLLKFFFGITFSLKYLERHEEKVIKEYEKLLNYISEEKKERLKAILEDEKSHERNLLSQLESSFVKYFGFVVLGLADAIVEISGVHAGFLGVTSSTIIAGVAGLVVGVSASIAMGSAAYIQAKQTMGMKPSTSAISTGISYLGAAALLATPYFLTEIMIIAFIASIIVAVILTSYFTFYSSVVFERKFIGEFLQNTALILATALASYLFGDFLGRFLGIHTYYNNINIT
jgi:VIT1/CCC1 family predicted Fe2+/Mn2+ transporter